MNYVIYNGRSLLFINAFSDLDALYLAKTIISILPGGYKILYQYDPFGKNVKINSKLIKKYYIEKYNPENVREYRWIESH